MQMSASRVEKGVRVKALLLTNAGQPPLWEILCKWCRLTARTSLCPRYLIFTTRRLRSWSHIGKISGWRWGWFWGLTGFQNCCIYFFLINQNRKDFFGYLVVIYFGIWGYVIMKDLDLFLNNNLCRNRLFAWSNLTKQIIINNSNKDKY